MPRRRRATPFSLSFLDIMFCGFGAVVLLVLILDRDVIAARNQEYDDLRGEVLRLEKEILIGRRHLTEARNRLEATNQERVTMEGEAERVIRAARDVEIQIARLEQQTLASKEHIHRLKSDLKTLDRENQRLNADTRADQDADDRLRRIQGDGDRQYLTGLRMGGQRVLILVDASASMLDETIVNVVRRRNMGEEQKKAAPKWRRALAAADWLVANLRGTHFQLYTFNTLALAAVPGTTGQWLATTDQKQLDATLAGLYRTIPHGGTSLHKAFEAARALSPKPDNILLLTDGLPSQGASKPSSTTVSAEKRLNHFNDALKRLPVRTPVNTILFPMEGDAHAAAAFWKLAIDTRGSFMTPARDWP